MTDARTLLLAARTQSERGDIATADLLLDAAITIGCLRTALRLARAALQGEPKC